MPKSLPCNVLDLHAGWYNRSGQVTGRESRDQFKAS
jgi:hypothetical protein